MKTPDVLIYFVGFLAQTLFGIRMISQWIQSERAGVIISPVFFWRTSLVASFLLLIYGILRLDAVIIYGQLLSYFIYIRNLQLKQAWHSIPPAFKFVAFFLPILTMGWLYSNNHLLTAILAKSNFMEPVIMIGSIGQLALNLRFVYQWVYSEKRKSSLLPFGFWVISIAGSLCVTVYAFYRMDPVLLVAQFLGLSVYTRNIMIAWNAADRKMSG